jgi:hypothetical protein
VKLGQVEDRNLCSSEKLHLALACLPAQEGGFLSPEATNPTSVLARTFHSLIFDQDSSALFLREHAHADGNDRCCWLKTRYQIVPPLAMVCLALFLSFRP